MVCNAARIRAGEKPFFLFGKKENTPSVMRMIERIDRGAHGDRTGAGHEAMDA